MSERHVTVATNEKMVAIKLLKKKLQSKIYYRKKEQEKMNKNFYIVIAIRLSNIVLTKNCDTGSNKGEDVIRSGKTMYQY